MIIPRAGNEVGASAAIAGSISRAFPLDVLAGSLIVVYGFFFSDAAEEVLVAGTCTQSAGTATLSTIQIDREDTQLDGSGGGDWIETGIWSAIVTGAGSLTLQLAGFPAASFLCMAIGEYPGNWDSNRVEGSTGLTSDTDSLTSFETPALVTVGEALFTACISMGDSVNPSNANPEGGFSRVYDERDGSVHNVGNACRLISPIGIRRTGRWTGLSGSGGSYSASLVAYREKFTPKRRPSVQWHRFEDDFNRANGNLDVSLSSDGKFRWAETQGTEWEILSNAAQAVSIADTTFNVAATDADTFTDDQFAQCRIATWTRPGGTSLSFGIAIRGSTYGAGGDGYAVEIGHDGGAIANKIYNFATDTSIDTDTTADPEDLGWLRVEARGPSIRAFWNGVEFLSANDATFKGGNGRRRIAITAFAGGGGAGTIAIEDLSYGDLVTGTRILRPRRSRDGMLNLGWLDPKRWF